MNIQGVSGMAAGMASAAGMKQSPAVQSPDEQARPHSLTPKRDEYVPEENREPSGRYWLGKDEDGQPKIYFDDPEKRDEPSAPSAPKKRAGDEKAERCTGNTDAVDREIERLKKRREELERQLGAEPDASRARQLEQKLTQVERELAQKDNDAYRRQHTVFS